MLKLKKLLIGIFLPLALAACSRQVSADAFFKAFQKLTESPALFMEGTMKTNGASTEIEASLDTDQKEAIIHLSSNGITQSYYAKDGKILFEDGGQSITSQDEELFDSLFFFSSNPFTSLSQKERENLFSSVTLSGDTYTMVFKPIELSRLIDEFGALDVKEAKMEATINDNWLEHIEFDLDASLNYGEGADLSLKASLSFQKEGAIVFPEEILQQFSS